MRLFLALVLTTILLGEAEPREYHYDRPAKPFYTGTPHQGPPHGHLNLPTVVRTLGPAGRDFEVYGMSSSRQIFESRHLQQTSAAAGPPHGQYLPPTALHPPPPPPPAAPHQSPAYLAPSTRVDLTVRVNPFNQIISVTKGGTLGNVYQHGGGSGPAPAPHPANPQQHAAAYAAVQQGAARGFHGAQGNAGGFNAGASAGSAGPFGNYVAQSEVGQLDVYAHQQQGGVARPFNRVITTCYPNGQCERTNLAPGQSDPRHQHIVLASRARTQPVSNKCQRIAAASLGASTAYAAPPPPAPGANYGPPPAPTTVQPARPNNRRLYPYTETVGSPDAFN